MVSHHTPPHSILLLSVDEARLSWSILVSQTDLSRSTMRIFVKFVHVRHLLLGDRDRGGDAQSLLRGRLELVDLLVQLRLLGHRLGKLLALELELGDLVAVAIALELDRRDPLVALLDLRLELADQLLDDRLKFWRPLFFLFPKGFFSGDLDAQGCVSNLKIVRE